MQPAEPNTKPGPAPYRGPVPTLSPATAPAPPPALPVKPPNSDLLKVGINAHIDDVNARVQEITDGHQKLFGHAPSPGLVYDIVRGWSQNKVPDISTLFTIPTSTQEAQAAQVAATHVDPIVKAARAAPMLATDPAAAKSIEQAQGHPLTPQQREALNVAQGKETVLKARSRLQEAGILPKLQIVHDEGDIFNQIAAGGFLFTSGLMASGPIIAIAEGKGIYDSFQHGPTALYQANYNIAKGVVKKTFADTQAIFTGNMKYLRDNPDAYYNVALLGLGAAGGLSKLSSIAAAAKEGGIAGAGREILLPKPPPPKKMTYGEASVNALNMTNPIVRMADNLRTNRMKARSDAGLEPVPAAVARALRMQTAGDFISKNFSYEAKFRRETEALRRSQYQMGIYLAKKLDDITASAIDAGSALADVPKATKNGLSLGELKSMHVLAQGGDWLEALGKMRDAHERWRDAALTAGAEQIARDNIAQLAALKLAEETLRKGDAEGFSKTFAKTFPIFREALEQSTTIKIDKLGLAPESADVRNALEFNVYDLQRSLPNRKKLASLIQGTETHVESLKNAKGYVVPELHAARDTARQELEALNKESHEAVRSHLHAEVMGNADYIQQAQRAMIKSPEEAKIALDRAQRNLRALKGKQARGEKATEGASHSFQEHIFNLDAEEAEAVLRGDTKAAREARAMQIAAGDDNLMEGISGAASKDLLAKAQRKVAAAEKKIAKAQEAEHPHLAAATKRLESLKMLMTEAEARVMGAEKREGAFRVPIVGRTRENYGSVPADFPKRGANRLGEYLPETPSEITHSFTGKGLIAGDIRLDFTNLAARDLARSVKAGFWMDEYHMKLATAKDRVPEGPTGKFYKPIRKKAEISDKMREIVNKIQEPGVTTEDISALTADEVDALNERAYARQNADGVWVDKDGKPINLKHYAWYDERAHPLNRPVEIGGLQKGFSTFYNYVGRPRIFLAPRYLLNLFSNDAMNAIHEHVMTPPALAASYFAKRIYDAETVDRIDVALGASRADSFGPTVKDSSLAEKVMTGITQFWHFVTDTHPRRAAFLYEAWRRGYVSAEQMSDLVKNPANIDDFNASSRVSQKAMVELGNMTWAEQQYLQHIMFVYPWRSRQAIWSLRTLAEHPGLSSILAQIGENALSDQEANRPTWIKEAIKHYQQIGYIITGWEPDGSPKAVDAGQINTFSGLMDMLSLTGSGGAQFNLDSLGPGLEFFYEAVKGKDQFGRDFAHKGSPQQVLDAFVNVAIGTQPLDLAYKRGGVAAKAPSIPPFNPASRGSLLTRINAAQKEVALSPGWLHGFGLLFTGGATPRTINKLKLLYTYYHGLDDAARTKFERGLINNVLNVQSHLLQKQIPNDVHTAIDVQNEWSFRQQQLSKKLGMNGGVPDLIKDELLMGVLKDKGLVDPKVAATEIKAVEKIKGALPADHTDARNAWMVKYAGGTALAQWDQDIKTLATFTPKGLEAKAARLKDFGLSRVAAPAASQDTLYGLGRQVVAFEDKVRKIHKEITAEADPERQAALKTELANALVEGDKPTKIAGKTFPSVSRLSYSDTPEKQRKEQLVSDAGQKWSTLPGLDKELLTGKPVDPVVSQAWAAINERMAQEKARLKPGQSLPAGLRQFYIDRVAKQSPAFAADLKFDQQQMATKLQTYRSIKTSAHSDDWSTLLTTAEQFANDRIKAGWVRSSGKPDWTAIQRDWVDRLSKIQNWVNAQTSPGFRQELRQYTSAHKNFIAHLVRP